MVDGRSDGDGECGVPECAGMRVQGAGVNLRKSRVLVSWSGIEWRQGAVEDSGPGVHAAHRGSRSLEAGVGGMHQLESSKPGSSWQNPTPPS